MVGELPVIVARGTLRGRQISTGNGFCLPQSPFPHPNCPAVTNQPVGEAQRNCDSPSWQDLLDVAGSSEI